MYLSPWLLAVILLLTACGSLVDTGRPADDRYWLEPLSPGGVAGDGAALQMALDAVPGLDTERVLVLGPGARLGQYQQARWADNLPEVLFSVLRRSLERHGFVVSGHLSGQPSGACALELEAREFFALADSSGVHGVRVSLGGSLDCAGTRYPLVLTADGRAGPGAADVADALQAALDEVTRALLRELERVPGYPRPLS